MSEKRRYSFSVVGGISLHIEVEAETLEEAIQEAQSASVQGLCHQCAGAQPGEWATSGELDCEPAGSELLSVSVDDEDIQGPEFFKLQEKWSDA